MSLSVPDIQSSFGQELAQVQSIGELQALEQKYFSRASKIVTISTVG
jgi:hypothetical protein